MNNPLYFMFCVLLGAFTVAGWTLGYAIVQPHFPVSWAALTGL